MRIWFAACIPATSVGGVARSIRELSMQLSQLGHECRIVDAGNARGNYLVFTVRLLMLFLFRIGHKPDWIIGRSTDAQIQYVAPAPTNTNPGSGMVTPYRRFPRANQIFRGPAGSHTPTRVCPFVRSQNKTSGGRSPVFAVEALKAVITSLAATG